MACGENLHAISFRGDSLQRLYLVCDQKSMNLMFGLTLPTVSQKNEYYVMSFKIPLYAAMEIKAAYDGCKRSKIYSHIAKLLNGKLFASINLLLLTVLVKRIIGFGYSKRSRLIKWSLAEESENKFAISHEESSKFLRLFEGRILRRSEIIKELKYLGKSEEESNFFLQSALDEEKCYVKPGISQSCSSFKCNRCESRGNFVIFSCMRCGSNVCMLCKECVSLGAISACEEIYVFPKVSKNFPDNLASNNIETYYEHPLTEAQKEVAAQLGNWLEGPKYEALVWAACGAGKTEVVFKIISKAISNSGRVMITIPRRDVVKELSERFKRAFPNTSIRTLYGGSKEKYDPVSKIVICTTHQAIRFFKQFDLVIIDEIDAYPYKSSFMLYNAVRRSMNDGCKTVMMTATPHKDLRAKVERGEVNCFRIPARHHKKPLPVPEIFRCKEKLSAKKLPQSVIELIFQIVLKKYKLFVFVPKRDMAHAVKSNLEDWKKTSHLASIVIESCTAADSKRDEKCADFAEGRIDIFVVTSILERGVTIDRASVIVLMADEDRIFDENALIQMAGRAGRTTKNPTGEVFFVCNKTTESMKVAVEQIENMNHYAYQRGYINYE